MATCLEERDKARSAVCDLPIHDLQQLMLALQIRGEAKAYNRMYNDPYELYEQLVEEAKENERTSTRASG